MQKQCITKSDQVPVINGVMVLYGCKIAIKVEKNFLSVTDGYCDIYRHSLLTKATCKLKRLVLLGNEGYITLSALEWLFSIRAGIIQIGWNGEIILASGPHREHIAIKRAQYTASGNSDGLKVARYLMTKKLQGQCEVLTKHAPDEIFTYLGKPFNTAQFINGYAAKIKRSESISEVLEIEGLTSEAYHGVISKIGLRFEKADRKYIPEHWLTFGPRHSFINPKNSRNATNPGNALLNYLYSLLCAETCIALLGAGFDPYAGIIHADSIYRASFIYDVIETVRPEAEMWLLDFVQSHVFSRKDFYQKPNGSVRVTLRLTPTLASTVGLWRVALFPRVSHLAAVLKSRRAE